MSNKYLVVDTAVLLHYKSIDQIDWSNISGCKTPTIYVPLVVIEELDKHKDQHRLRKMRERARKALALIDKIIGESFSGQLGKNVQNVQLVVGSEDPKINWEALNLDKNKPDHRVIASALSMASDSNQVAVVQRDYGMKLTLRRLKLQSVELPADLQLEDALDESDRELKELRRENERLKSQFPKLCLESGEESNRGLIVVGPELLSYSTTEQEEILERLREEYPLMEMRNIRSGPSSSALISMGLAITDKQRESYNDKLSTFYEEYLNWLVKTRDLKNKKSLLMPIELWIFNSGSCPAQDVDVEILFPNCVSVLLGENTLELPPEPKPPEQPKPNSLNMSIPSLPPDFRINPVVSNFSSLKDIISSPPEASIYEDERGTCVAMHWDSIKHGYRHQILPKPHVQFESYESLRGFQLEYLISAANLPSASEGTFDVELKIKQPE